MPTLVEVYVVESDDSTGPFLGFGSMLDRALVFLHPQAAPQPELPRPIEPRSIRPGPTRPGPFRPAFPDRPGVAQRLHDEVVTGPVVAARRNGGRARCRIRNESSVLTLDGDVLPAPSDVEAPTAIQLDMDFYGDIDEVDLWPGPALPTAEEAAAAVLTLVSAAALSDPTAPTDPPPSGPDVGGARAHPGRRPWYCVICPGAVGC